MLKFCVCVCQYMCECGCVAAVKITIKQIKHTHTHAAVGTTIGSRAHGAYEQLLWPACHGEAALPKMFSQRRCCCCCCCFAVCWLDLTFGFSQSLFEDLVALFVLA